MNSTRRFWLNATLMVLATSFMVNAGASSTAFAGNECAALFKKAGAERAVSTFAEAVARGQQKEFVTSLLLKAPAVPAMLKQTRFGQIPVVLMTDRASKDLAPLIQNSMGTIIVQQSGYNNDHGEMRVAENIIDVDLPGGRGFGEINKTGIAWKSQPEYLKRKIRDENASYNWIEVGYVLTPQEMMTATAYQLMRRAAIIRVPFTFGGAAVDKNLPNMLSAGEHCFIFCKASAIDSHIVEMKRKISDRGVNDVSSLMKSPEVQRFYDLATERLLLARNDPEKLKPKLLNTARLFSILKPVLPPDLNKNDRALLINWIYGLESTSRYASLRATLGFSSDMGWNDMNRTARASFILVYGKTSDEAHFRDGSFVSNGVFANWDAQNQVPLK